MKGTSIIKELMPNASKWSENFLNLYLTLLEH